ncbi:T9SS type A sorting domain-containing protein [Hymenobacter terricola]|uniref:T9SS type A sorting domain-containing protein n=1 Tax=Hymenobacter terricola TaxID=2819236 RepID=UPI001B3174B9|nr:T9SS type A sorting domain-containing protein [Hymenobacter terricola]
MLAKYDSTGQVKWVKQLRNLIVAQQGVAVVPTSGDVFVLASAQASPTWGGIPVATAGQPAFYAKVSGSGNIVWVKPLPAISTTAANNFGVGFTADDLGNCYLMSRVRSPATVGGVAVDSLSTFLFQADGSGNISWVRKFQSRTTNPARNAAIAVIGLGPKPGGGCVLAAVAGTPNPVGTLYYGPAANTAIGTADGNSFIANIDVAGNLLWRHTTPAFSLQNLAPGDTYAVAADAAGNCYGTGQFGNGGLGVVKYDAAGIVQWVRYTASPGPGYNGAGTHLVVDGAGNVTVLCGADFQTGPAAIPPYVLGAVTLRSHLNVVRFGPDGQEQWAVGDVPGPIVLFGTSGLHAYFLAQAGSLGLDRRGNIYYTSQVVELDSVLHRSGPPAVRLGAQTLAGRGVVVARVGTRHDLLIGRVYLDANGNGQRDTGEGPLPFPLVLQAVQPSLTTLGTADASGLLTMCTDSGNYQLSAPNIPAHYTLVQPASAAYAGRMAGYGRTDSLRHFGLFPLANQADLRVTLTPYSGARPGFTTRYRLTVQNVGTTTVASGTATVTLDSRMAYISSTPAGSRTGQTVTWAYTNLPPFSKQEFDILFSLPVNTALGTQLTSTATAPLAADVAPADNTASTPQTVTGSFDPNDIEVNYQRITPAQVAAGLPLDYTIRFQNMGTDTAFTVVVKDTLNFQKLNLTSLQLVAQSHNCIWSLTGRGELTVRFLNIKLPYRNQDVIRSQGFVRFRVQPKTTLAVGEVIPNHASIVFDYNNPLHTNTATTTVFLATAALASHEAAAWTAYPNPATDAITLAADLATAGPVRIELLDALGRPVRQQTLTAPAGPLRQTVDLRGLASGLYLLRLTPPTGPATSRQVVRE